MYNNNPQLRGPEEAVNMTEKRMSEWLKCKEDILYFAENYCTITTIDDGKIKIPLRHYQKKMLKAFFEPTENRKHVVVNSARQIGKTTVSIIYLLWYALFEEHKTIAILANKEKTAIEILRRLKFAYQEMPLWLQQGISEADGGWNKSQVGLTNGIKIISGSTASTAIRGEVGALVFLDEFAFVPENIADDFMSSVYPTLATGKKAKMIIVSTPNGLNQFYQIFTAAVRRENNFMPIQVNWNEVPGRNKKWREQIMRDIGPQKWAQEFGCQFLGSSNTLIDPSLLERMHLKNPVLLKLENYLNVYKEPEEGVMYILGVDSAKGTGKDYSAIQVLKINNEHDIEQVALYRNNQIEARDFAQVCISVSQYYNEAYMMVENNDVGETVANTIWFEYEYDKILNCDKKGIGIRSTKKSKLAANILLKRYMENGWLDIIDRNTLYELSRYEEIRPNVFSAGRDQNDDCVTSLLWGVYFLTTMFFDGRNLDIKKIDDKFLLDRVAEDVETPIAIFDDGEAIDIKEETGLEEGWGYMESGDETTGFMF